MSYKKTILRPCISFCLTWFMIKRTNWLGKIGRYFKSNNQNLFPFMLLPPEEAPKALTADPTSGDLFSWSLMFKTSPSCSIPPKIRALWTNNKKSQYQTLILASYFSWKGLDHKVAQDTFRDISASYEAIFFLIWNFFIWMTLFWHSYTTFLIFQISQ